jgi:hypothetical protein
VLGDAACSTGGGGAASDATDALVRAADTQLVGSLLTCDLSWKVELDLLSNRLHSGYQVWARLIRRVPSADGDGDGDIGGGALTQASACDSGGDGGAHVVQSVSLPVCGTWVWLGATRIPRWHARLQLPAEWEGAAADLPGAGEGLPGAGGVAASCVIPAAGAPAGVAAVQVVVQAVRAVDGWLAT